MINRIVHFSLRFRGTVVALACLLVGYGLYVAVHAKLDVFPNFVPPEVVIQTESPGLSPEQVEALAAHEAVGVVERMLVRLAGAEKVDLELDGDEAQRIELPVRLGKQNRRKVELVDRLADALSRNLPDRLGDVRVGMRVGCQAGRRTLTLRHFLRRA